MFSYLSVCSGIESATVAWEPLGAEPVAFAEVDAYPSAVLQHHWPHVLNMGDMKLLPDYLSAGLIPAPDVLVGGTPCQGFSVSGARKGLSDPRGQLTLAYVNIANQIDIQRKKHGKPPCVTLWENVPGVFTLKDNSFGCFLGALAGEDCELKPPGKKWEDVGCVFGPQRAIAWRVLDAQYFGLAQRRRRVFVVASAREGFDPTRVLFESESPRRDSAPRRRTREDIALDFKNGVNVSKLAYGFPTRIARNGRGNDGDVVSALTAQAGISGKGDSAPCVVYPADVNTFSLMFCDANGRRKDRPNGGLYVTENPDTSTTLTCSGPPPVFVTFPSGEVPPSLAFAQNSRNEVRLQGGDGEISGALSAQPGMKQQTYVAPGGFNIRKLTPRECERLQGFPDDHTLITFGKAIRPEKMDADFAKYLMRGGKMTFEQCLQAASDGLRYKALGNSKAVPVVRWIGERLVSYFKTQV